MKRMLRRFLVSLLAVTLVLVATSTSAFAANRKFIEPDEADTDGSNNSPPIKNASGSFDIHSPYRGSADPTLSEWPNIAGMYNEPRSSTSMHLGVDIAAADGRPIYPVHGDSSSDDAYVLEVGDTGSSGYGKYIVLRHRDNVGGIDYYFDTRYAHARKILKTSGSVSYTDPIAETGCTGTCNGYHVHLEFMTRYAKATDGSPRRHPPAAFFYGKAPSPWWLDTSFITRLPNNGDCVRFRTVHKHSDKYYAASQVSLYYKVGLNGTWQSVSMIPEGSSACTQGSSGAYVHYYNLASVAPRSSDVLFYVSAVESKYNRRAWRPWRHTDGDPPSDRPFYEYID
ncbi:MAG: M23 family metallopeptidase [Clostridiales bacterium]|nr:M23 family metallopeptidase [Clostridiales bacterium]